MYLKLSLLFQVQWGTWWLFFYHGKRFGRSFIGGFCWVPTPDCSHRPLGLCFKWNIVKKWPLEVKLYGNKVWKLAKITLSNFDYFFFALKTCSRLSNTTRSYRETHHVGANECWGRDGYQAYRVIGNDTSSLCLWSLLFKPKGKIFFSWKNMSWPGNFENFSFDSKRNYWSIKF